MIGIFPCRALHSPCPGALRACSFDARIGLHSPNRRGRPTEIAAIGMVGLLPENRLISLSLLIGQFLWLPQCCSPNLCKFSDSVGVKSCHRPTPLVVCDANLRLMAVSCLECSATIFRYRFQLTSRASSLDNRIAAPSKELPKSA